MAKSVILVLQRFHSFFTSFEKNDGLLIPPVEIPGFRSFHPLLHLPTLPHLTTLPSKKIRAEDFLVYRDSPAL